MHDCPMRDCSSTLVFNDICTNNARINDHAYNPVIQFLNTVGAACGGSSTDNTPLDDFNANNNFQKTGHITATLTAPLG